jgi:hypothetical protein
MEMKEYICPPSWEGHKLWITDPEHHITLSRSSNSFIPMVNAREYNMAAFAVAILIQQGSNPFALGRQCTNREDPPHIP